MAERYYSRVEEVARGANNGIRHAKAASYIRSEDNVSAKYESFTAAKSPKRSWTERYLYLVVESEACVEAHKLVLW